MMDARPDADLYDAELVEGRLYEAGLTLLELPVPGTMPAGFKSCMPVPIDTLLDAERAIPPPIARITRMEEALRWIPLIPDDKMHMRRVVSAHMLIIPKTLEPLFSFRRLGTQLGISHHTVQSRWYRGIDIIVGRLNQPGLCQRPNYRGARGRIAAALERAREDVRKQQLELAS